MTKVNLDQVFERTNTPTITADEIATAALDAVSKMVRAALPNYPEEQMMITPDLSVTAARANLRKGVKEQ